MELMEHVDGRKREKNRVRLHQISIYTKMDTTDFQVGVWDSLLGNNTNAIHAN